MTIYVGYARKSSENSERQILSINDQTRGIREKFVDLAIQDIIPESKSAFKPYNRPRFDEVLDQIERGEVQGLLAWHPNRLARNEIDAARIVYLIRSGKLLDLQFVTFTFENTPEGIWMLQMQLSQSQYESAKLGSEVKRGTATKLALGHFPHKAPPGYRNSGPTTNKGERYVYADKKRLPLVRRAFELALTGNYTTAEVFRTMQSWGFTTHGLGRKPKLITYSQVHKMLRNIFYSGQFEHGGELHRGDYPAILSRQEYERLQEILHRHKDDKSRRITRRNYVHYNGLMRCACGLMITATEKRKYYHGTNREARYIYYNCTRKGSRRIACHQPRMSEAQLHQAFIDEIRKYRISPEFRDLALEQLRARLHTREQEVEQVQASQRAELTALQTKMQALIDMRADGEIEAADFKTRQSAYKDRMAQLEQQLNRDPKLRASAVATTESLLTDLTILEQRFSSADPKTKREILMNMAVDSNLVLMDRKLHFQAKKWLSAISESYHPLEVEYLSTRTSDFGSMNERKTALMGIISIWCTKIDTVTDLIEVELAAGNVIPRLLPDENKNRIGHPSARRHSPAWPGS